MPSQPPRSSTWLSTWTDSKRRLRHAQGLEVALAAFGVGQGSTKMREEEVRKIELAYPEAFCRGQGWRRSCVRGHDSSRREPRSRDEVREDHRGEGEGRRVRQV